MITIDQVRVLSKKYKTNESTIFREYIQVLWLSKLYSFKQSDGIFFKGGTAIHLIFKAPRFSEDLDFTVNLKEKELINLVRRVYKDLSLEMNVELKERKTIAGKRFLLIANPQVLPYKTFVNLDFSFREEVVIPQKSIIETEYPVLFSSFVYHLSTEELLAEKMRAILTRRKERDLYDIWFLISIGANFKDDLIKEKFKYYHLKVSSKDIIARIDSFDEKSFVLNLRPFVPIPERERLPEFFKYIKDVLKKRLEQF